MGGYPQHLPTTPGSRPDNTSGLLPEMRVDVERRGECTASTERVHSVDTGCSQRYKWGVKIRLNQPREGTHAQANDRSGGDGRRCCRTRTVAFRGSTGGYRGEPC